ncbi:MAG: pyruvate dehydrogenase complex dihydrolipoamide acetyltransferase [Gemmatimonadetes bacterium]|nr:pyruvate dehydrogenase complex dihydrolipoamide acetyltransferase [Gemmatimonadota bacterium]
MATKVMMEALSPTMEEGRVIRWLKREGDAVASGDTLAEVETDKAVMELVARGDGILRKVLAPEGTTVEVGKLVAVIAGASEDVSGIVGERESGVESRESRRPGPAAAAGETEPSSVASRTTVPRGAAVATATPTPPPAAPTPMAGRVKASPLARRLAEERGVDLRVVSGSGPGGRVVKRDLEGAPAPAPRLPTPDSRLPRADVAAGGYRDVPLTQIRKTIAKRLAQSLAPIPHFFLTSEIDMERAWDAREELNRIEGGPRISFNDIILKAVALALVQHPECNAWWQDDHIRYFADVHLGIAVAVEDGLITPVLRSAQAKALRQIAGESRDLSERARARKLKPEEYTGSTFSVSNLGMFDIHHFTAVINPPEAGILAVGSITQQPVVSEGQLTARRRMRVTMSCDHRVIDGATGARFLQTLKRMLENPLAMVW